jgi:RNA polymerase subunit RPABC4/transcription elongation factor Spt4
MSKEGRAVSHRVCPHCKNLLEATWKRCPYCGRNLVLPPICPNCKSLLQEDWQACPYCGGNPGQPPPPPSSRYEAYETPSLAWYLVPLLFGLIGGLIGYVGTKDRDNDMATNLLVFGIIWSLFLAFIGWALIASL